MFEILTISAVFFLIIIGVSELLHRIWMFMLRPKKTYNFLITVLDNSCAAEQVAATLEDMRWNGKNSACLLIGVNCGLSEETAEECRMIAELNDDFIVCTGNEIFEEILKRS